MPSLLQSSLQKTCPQDSWTLEGREKVQEMESFPLFEEGGGPGASGWNQCAQIHRPWWDPCVLRELAEVITKLLSIIFDRFWRIGEVPEDWRIANVIQWSSRRARKRILATAGQSVSPLSLERWWNNLFWMTSPSNWKRQPSSEIVSMDSPRRNHAQPTS